MKKNHFTQLVIKDILFSRLSYRLLIVLLALVATVTGLLVPYYQKSFMLHFDLQFLAICTFLALVSFLTMQLTTYLGQREALICQRVLSEKIYNHILSLKALAVRNRTVGEMVSLYTTDVPSATMWLEQTIPYALTTAFPLIVTPFFLFLVYDIPVAFTASMIAVIIAVNLALARRQSFFFFKFKMLAAQRMGLVNEWIQNIRGLKSLNWITGFEKKIITKRIEETNNRIAMVTNGQLMNSISSSITFWLNLFVIWFIVYISPELTAKIHLITLLWVMGVFLSRPLRQLPWFFTMMFDAWTSIKRLGEFFSLHNTDHIIKNKNYVARENLVLDVKNLNLYLDGKIFLKKINLEITNSEIVALIGPVGSGKSTFLKSLMKETSFAADSLVISPYNFLPQESFILSASVYENIVFDYTVDHQNKTSAMNALQQAQFDLNQDRLKNGLDTIIGERGLNISGGQKQRLNLARLFYNPKPLFLLDDPLSAIDVGTEKKLIETFLYYKSIGHSFLVTTQRYEFLRFCDRIIYMDQGEIKFIGDYKTLCQNQFLSDFIKGEKSDALIVGSHHV